MSPLHLKLIELDRRKDEVKKFFEEYKETLEALVKEHGVGHAFQDDAGIVYQLAEANGKWVAFDKFNLERTKREGEKAGTISVKRAQELGFEVK
jgi:hypothetical protein